MVHATVGTIKVSVNHLIPLRKIVDAFHVKIVKDFIIKMNISNSFCRSLSSESRNSLNNAFLRALYKF